MKLKSAILLSLFALGTSQAAILFQLEAPGVQQTTVSFTLTETFDALPTGSLGSYTSPIGQYSAGATIQSGNAWGGTQQTHYPAVGAQSRTYSYSLTFFEDQAYFGFFWGAADSRNEVRFYDNCLLQASFRAADIFVSLPNTYKANPNTGANPNQHYAFVNFFATKGMLFDQVVFANDNFNSGFETDSHTILRPSDPVTPTVDAETPEPATLLLTGAAFGLLALRRRFC